VSEFAMLPSDHYLYDLRIRSEGDGESGSAWMAITAEMLGDSGGLRAGLLVALIDGAAGRLAVRAALPRLVATSHIGVRTSTPARGEVLFAETAVLRRGRDSIAISTTLYEHALAPGGDALAEAARGRSIGRSVATFTTIASSYDESVVAALERDEFPSFAPAAQLAEPFFSAIGLRAVDADAGVFELPLSPYVENHVHCLQGGIYGALVEAAAESACRAATGTKVVVLDLSIPYLAMGRQGPFRTAARIVRATREHAVAEVDVLDVGHGGRLITRATAVACVQELA